MSITSLLPVRIGLFDRAPRKPRHRAVDEVDRLRFLLDGAGLCIRGLHVQLADLAGEHAEVVARIDERHGEIVRGLEKQLEDLRERLRISSLAESAVAKTQEIPVISESAIRPVPLNQAPFATVDPGRL